MNPQLEQQNADLRAEVELRLAAAEQAAKINAALRARVEELEKLCERAYDAFTGHLVDCPRAYSSLADCRCIVGELLNAALAGKAKE